MGGGSGHTAGNTGKTLLSFMNTIPSQVTNATEPWSL
jgi:hypothetical protein